MLSTSSEEDSEDEHYRQRRKQRGISSRPRQHIHHHHHEHQIFVSDPPRIYEDPSPRENFARLYRQIHGSSKDHRVVTERLHSVLERFNDEHFLIDTNNIDEHHAQQVEQHLLTHEIHKSKKARRKSSQASSSVPPPHQGDNDDPIDLDV